MKNAPDSICDARWMNIDDWIEWRRHLASEMVRSKADRNTSSKVLFSAWWRTAEDWKKSDWSAFRERLEGFYPPDADPLSPTDSLTPAEASRRDSVVCNYIDRLKLGRWSPAIELAALKDDRSKKPERYEGCGCPKTAVSDALREW